MVADTGRWKGRLFRPRDDMLFNGAKLCLARGVDLPMPRNLSKFLYRHVSIGIGFMLPFFVFGTLPKSLDEFFKKSGVQVDISAVADRTFWLTVVAFIVWVVWFFVAYYRGMQSGKLLMDQ
jgi:hypothetical protein